MTRRLTCVLLVLWSVSALAQEAPRPTLDLTEADLGEIKAAVLRHYETKKPHNWEGFAQELRRGAFFPAEEGRGPRIGMFELALKNDRLALIRQPPPASVMAYFGFFLAKVDGQWVVLDEYFEEERIIEEEE
ncbi:MAG TPA: hypothetical protein VNM67_11815 [Thermoanaerobaculia bacterium]|jgi:hypothetical protein|nr:hypothetical protein [Thermoanaerobaculia bacterium]